MEKPKYLITLLPNNQSVESDGSKNILETLKEKGIFLKSGCGGHASCTDCIVKVVSGEDNLQPPEFAEIKILGNIFHITKERLSCQTRICGNVTLDIARHDPALLEAERERKSKQVFAKKIIRRSKNEQNTNSGSVPSGEGRRENSKDTNRDWHKKGGNRRAKMFKESDAETTKREMAKEEEWHRRNVEEERDSKKK